ncbi:hypothetical protein KAZ57_01250 [Patescibacteria group bacterium]|nr:hypothetical protein [Patescibacteria group bacterium]
MSELLVHLYGNRSFNRAIFRPHIYVYDDVIVYKKRHLLSQEEKTISYFQITQVNIKKLALLFAHFEIVTTGSDTLITVRFVSKKNAMHAKKIIDQKLHELYMSYKSADLENKHSKHIDNVEKSLIRLRELRMRGIINDNDFKKKKAELLKSVK